VTGVGRHCLHQPQAPIHLSSNPRLFSTNLNKQTTQKKQNSPYNRTQVEHANKTSKAKQTQRTNGVYTTGLLARFSPSPQNRSCSPNRPKYASDTAGRGSVRSPDLVAAARSTWERSQRSRFDSMAAAIPESRGGMICGGGLRGWGSLLVGVLGGAGIGHRGQPVL